jgi:hypothetical protein
LLIIHGTRIASVRIAVHVRYVSSVVMSSTAPALRRGLFCHEPARGAVTESTERAGPYLTLATF